MDNELALRTIGYLIGYYKTHDETMINSQEIEAIDFLLEENQKYKEVIDKAIELLGNYKHYSTSDEQQNSDNEDLVNKAFNILKEVK